MNEFELDKLKIYIDNGYINQIKHPVYDISLYKYTRKTVFERYWDDYTLNLRGTVLDSNGLVVSMPFQKIFNYTEDQSIHIDSNSEDTPTLIYEKMDGTLLTLFNYNGKWNFATQQTFDSVYTERAKSIFQNKYSEVIQLLDPSKTYMFELISDISRVVINYDDIDDLYLIGIRDNITLKYDWIEFNNLKYNISTPKLYLYSSSSYDVYNFISNIEHNPDLENKEGVVLYQPMLDRVIKFKTKKYVELHKIRSTINENSIYNFLLDNKNTTTEEMLENIPDEWYDIIRKTQRKIYEEMYRIIQEISDTMSSNEYILKYITEPSKSNRKDFAESIKDFKYKSIIFKFLDDKQDTDIIFKYIKKERK